MEVMPRIRQEYIDTGKIRFVYRDFPLDRVAFVAHMLAHCGGSTKFPAFINALYEQKEF